jgi:hypothetical protein
VTHVDLHVGHELGVREHPTTKVGKVVIRTPTVGNDGSTSANDQFTRPVGAQKG